MPAKPRSCSSAGGETNLCKTVKSAGNRGKDLPMIPPIEIVPEIQGQSGAHWCRSKTSLDVGCQHAKTNYPLLLSFNNLWFYMVHNFVHLLLSCLLVSYLIVTDSLAKVSMGFCYSGETQAERRRPRGRCRLIPTMVQPLHIQRFSKSKRTKNYSYKNPRWACQARMKRIDGKTAGALTTLESEWSHRGWSDDSEARDLPDLFHGFFGLQDFFCA